MEVLILEEIFSSRCLFIAGLVGVVGCLLDVFDCVELWRLSKKDNELTDVIALFRKLLQLKPGKQLRSNNNYRADGDIPIVFFEVTYVLPKQAICSVLML